MKDKMTKLKRKIPMLIKNENEDEQYNKSFERKKKKKGTNRSYDRNFLVTNVVELKRKNVYNSYKNKINKVIWGNYFICNSQKNK